MLLAQKKRRKFGKYHFCYAWFKGICDSGLDILTITAMTFLRAWFDFHKDTETKNYFHEDIYEPELLCFMQTMFFYLWSQ